MEVEGEKRRRDGGERGEERFKRDLAHSSERGWWEEQKLVEPVEGAHGSRIVRVVNIA